MAVLMPTWHVRLAEWAALFDLADAGGRDAFRRHVVRETRTTPIGTLRMVAGDVGGEVWADRRRQQVAIADAWAARVVDAV